MFLESIWQREARCVHPPKSSRREYRMVNALTSEQKTSRNVVGFQIGEFVENLRG